MIQEEGNDRNLLNIDVVNFESTLKNDRKKTVSRGRIFPDEE